MNLNNIATINIFNSSFNILPADGLALLCDMTYTGAMVPFYVIISFCYHREYMRNARILKTCLY